MGLHLSDYKSWKTKWDYKRKFESHFPFEQRSLKGHAFNPFTSSQILNHLKNRFFIWHSHSTQTVSLLRSQRCWQNSPQNYEALETLAGPSRRLRTQTGTFRPLPGTACRTRGSVAVRSHARLPAEWKGNTKDEDLVMRIPTSCTWLPGDVLDLWQMCVSWPECNIDSFVQMKHLQLNMQSAVRREDPRL